MFDFRKWIEEQKGPYTLTVDDHDHYRIETPYGLSEITFCQFEGENSEIVELRNTCKKTGTTKFFLHFQPVDEEHSADLFHEMISSLLALKDAQTTRVLLFCTAGMTTSFFAEKLNDVAKILDLDYEFHAVSVSDVYAEARNYEVILIAPQVAYEEKNLRERIRDRLILRIPVKIFASYDANGCIEFVRESLQEYHQNRKKKKNRCSCIHDKEKGKYLLIATAPSDTDTRINYRIVENGVVIKDRSVIKKNLDLYDLEDIISVEVLSGGGKPFDTISLAVPGVVQNGRLDLPRTHGNNLQGSTGNMFELKEYFEKKTSVPVLVENNANCAALGWYSSQDRYKNICFMSLPNGWMIGGQGNVVNGKLVRGAHGIAGEIKYFMNELQIEKPLSMNPYHLDSILQLVTKAILVNIAILDPEAVVIRCEMLPYPEEIRKELMKYLPEERIPDIIHVEDFNDYVLLGQQKLCLDYGKSA